MRGHAGPGKAIRSTAVATRRDIICSAIADAWNRDLISGLSQMLVRGLWDAVDEAKHGRATHNHVNRQLVFAYLSLRAMEGRMEREVLEAGRGAAAIKSC